MRFDFGCYEPFCGDVKGSRASRLASISLRVRQALTKGQALIVFDPESEQCQLMLKHDVPKHLFD